MRALHKPNLKKVALIKLRLFFVGRVSYADKLTRKYMNDQMPHADI